MRAPGGGTMTARQACRGRHWSPYGYAPTAVDGDGAPVKPFPARLDDLARRAVTDALGADALPPAPYDIAPVNFYDPDARMGTHRDADERADAPAVSRSLGDTCVFRIGNPRPAPALKACPADHAADAGTGCPVLPAT